MKTQLASMRLGVNPSVGRTGIKRKQPVVHIVDGKDNQILSTITNQNVIDDDHKKSLEDTIESYEITTIADDKFAEHLAERNRLIIPGEDGDYREFIIDKVVKKRKGTLKIRVLSIASYLELKKAEPIEPQELTEYTPSMILGVATNNTEWIPGRTESSNYRTFELEEYTKPLDLLKRAANEFDLELKFRIETEGGKVTGRYIDMVENVGKWRGREITFGKDLDTIKREEDFENIYTALICIGPEDDEGERLETVVEDKDALRRWGRRNTSTGELMHLYDVYEPDSDDSEMTIEQLEQYGRTELDKRINSVITYEADVVDLENVPGMQNKKIRFGDTVRIKDEKFKPPLFVEARIFEQDRSVFSSDSKHVKLGDFTEFTEEEVQSVWQSLQAQINARVSQAEMIEYTYDKVTIDTKDEDVFEEGKSFSEAVGVDAKEFASDQDEIVKQEAETYADTVSSDAENSAKDYADTVGDNTLAQAKLELVAQESYDNQMQNIANELEGKSSIEYVDGQLVDKANVGDVYTIEDVDNMINNVVSITEYETDMQGIVETLDSQSTQIGQNEQQISLKADNERVDNVEGELETQSAEISTMSEEINLRVTQSEFEGLQIGGRNLISPRPENWNATSGAEMEILGDYHFKITNPENGSWARAESQQIELKDGETVVASAHIIDYHYRVSFAIRDEDVGQTLESLAFEEGDSVEERREYIKYTNETGQTINISIWINAFGENDDNEGDQYLELKEVQLEKATRPTGFRPMAEDIDIRISQTESEISQQSDKIALVVTEANTVNAETIASEIAITPSAIELISDEITLEANRINFDGHVFGQDATFEGTIEGAEILGSTFEQSGSNGTITLGSDGLVFDGANSSIEMNVQETSGFHSDIASIVFRDNNGNRAMEMGQYYTDSYIRSDRYLGLSSGTQGLGIDGSAYYDEFGEPGIRMNGGIRVDELSVFESGLSLPNAYSGSGRDNGITFGDEDNHTVSVYQDSWTFYGDRSNGYPFLLRTHNNGSSFRNDFWINDEGLLYTPATYDNTSSGSSNVRISFTGGEEGQYRLYRSTSAKKYKKDIKPIDVNPYDILKIEPKSWIDKREYEDNGSSKEGLDRHYGIIADDFEDVGLSEYVDYVNGELENIEERAWTLLIPIVRDLKNEVDELKQKLGA